MMDSKYHVETSLPCRPLVLLLPPPRHSFSESTCFVQVHIAVVQKREVLAPGVLWPFTPCCIIRTLLFLQKMGRMLSELVICHHPG